MPCRGYGDAAWTRRCPRDLCRAPKKISPRFPRRGLQRGARTDALRSGRASAANAARRSLKSGGRFIRSLDEPGFLGHLPDGVPSVRRRGGKPEREVRALRFLARHHAHSSRGTTLTFHAARRAAARSANPASMRAAYRGCAPPRTRGEGSRERLGARQTARNELRARSCLTLLGPGGKGPAVSGAARPQRALFT